MFQYGTSSSELEPRPQYDHSLRFKSSIPPPRTHLHFRYLPRTFMAVTMAGFVQWGTVAVNSFSRWREGVHKAIGAWIWRE